jgi:hypothetical protein
MLGAQSLRVFKKKELWTFEKESKSRGVLWHDLVVALADWRRSRKTVRGRPMPVVT